MTIKVLWFTVGKPKKEKKRSVRKKETTPVKEKQLPIEKTEAESLQPVQSEPSIQPEKKQQSKQAKKPKSKAEPKDKRKKDSEKNSGNSGCVGGIIDVINNISLQLKDERNKRVLNLVLKYVRILLRHALPGSHVIDLKLGLKDPATLGELIGAIAVIRSMTGIVIQVTPDFEQEILEADCYFKGRIRLGTLLYIGLRVYFNKDFKSLLKQLRNK